MTPAHRQRAARVFWTTQQEPQDLAQAAMLIAQQMKFRPKFVLGLDADRRAKYLANISALPDVVAARVLVAYHLAEQRPMMGAFLDALGIAHEDGLIQDEDVRPEAERIAPAAAVIAEKFPAEDVSLYLATLLWQDPEAWAPLASLPQVAR
jgi:hypothetical protein